MKNKLLRIALLAGILGSFFAVGRRAAQAADYSVQTYPYGIGKDMDKFNLRTPGIAYSVDGVLKEFSYDVFNKTVDGSWKYDHTRINDLEKGPDITNKDDGNAMIQVNNRSQGKHYQVHAARLRESLGDFSVVTHCYSGGEDIYFRKEYSFMSYSDRLRSVMVGNELAFGGFTSEEDSLVYNFYRPRALDARTEVAVQAGEGKLEHGGVAYYTEDGYYLRKLPTASLVKPGYSVEFLGWFDAREGGSQIQQDTWVPSGTTLYARWNIVPKAYNVTCYDICGDTPAGKVLGEYSWRSAYGTSVSGKELGECRESGSYYRGYTYENDTTAVVSTSGAKVYRYFSEDTYHITFDGNGATGGKMSAMENCAYSHQITLTQNCFQKEYCVTLDGNAGNVVCETEKFYVYSKFLGWALTPDGPVMYSDGAVVSSLVAGEESITLYAVWSDEKFRVSETPRRMGYEFAGWADTTGAENGRTQFTASDNMTLYAVWKPGIVPYYVEYYKENIEGRYEMVSSYAFQGYTGQKAEIHSEEKQFLGYFLDRHSSVLSGTIQPDGSLILTAFYARNLNKVSYDMNGGEKTELPEPVMRKYGEELTLWEKSDFKRSGYTFAGWSQDADGKNQVFAPGEKLIMPNHEMLLYAVWKPFSYEIQLDANGAEYSGKSQNITAAYDEKIQLPVCQAKKTGYEFAGWNTLADGTGVSYSCEETVQKLCGREGESIRLFAQWQPISFDISYDANVSGELSESVRGIVADTSYSFIKDSYTARDIFYLKGYHFLGWNTRADGSGKMFFPGENIAGKIADKKDCVLYAIWKLGENIEFYIDVVEEGTEESLDTLRYYGRSGEKLSEALKRACRETLQGEPVEYFYPGYEVVNREALEQKVQGDHSTLCRIIVKRRSCSLHYGAYQQGIAAPFLTEGGYAYQEQVKLRERLEYLGREQTVIRYVDSAGKTYLPGESVTLEKNLTLIPQFQIVIYGEDGKKDRVEYCCWGRQYALPGVEKKGYEFLGWYAEEGSFLGKEGTLLSGIEDIVLYPKWSGPLRYQISYDGEESVLRILENKVSQYQYQTEVKLPDKNQVLSLRDDYEFVGWYLAGEEEQNLIDRLQPGMYGDVVLKAKFTKKSTLPDGGDKTEAPEKPGQTGDDGSDSQKPGQTGDDGSDSQKPGQAGDSGNASQKPDGGKHLQSVKQKTGLQKKAEKAPKTGTVFWKGQIKYQITSCKKGRMTVKIVGNRYRKKNIKLASRISFRGTHYRVTAIGGRAFQGNKYIRKMTVASSVQIVGKQAFARMKKLSRIYFGRNLKRLGARVCYQDTSLKRLRFHPSRKLQVGKQAFAGCKKLRQSDKIMKKIK